MYKEGEHVISMYELRQRDGVLLCEQYEVLEVRVTKFDSDYILVKGSRSTFACSMKAVAPCGRC